MKKVLLSLSMLAAVMTVSAQSLVPVYGGNPKNIKDSVNSEDGFKSFDPAAGETVPADWTNSEKTDPNTGNVYLELSGTGEYYVWGTSNGNYKADGSGLKPLGYTGTNAGFVAFQAKSNGTNPKSKIKIGFITTDGKTFASEVFEAGAHATFPAQQLSNAWKVFNLPLNRMPLENVKGEKLDANGIKIADQDDSTKYVYPTNAQVQDFAQINIICNVQSCDWNGSACDITAYHSSISIDDVYLTQNKLTTLPSIPVLTSTKSAAANIASTRLYPNPSTSAFIAEVSLKSAASTTIILSDMMGKQISSKSVDANGQANFETAGLASGIYTVTYVVDGTPAKSELVVVK